MTKITPTNAENTDTNNFPSSDNDTIEPSIDRIARFRIIRKRALLVSCLIVVIGLTAVTIALRIKPLTTKNSDAVDDPSKQTPNTFSTASTTSTPGVLSPLCTDNKDKSLFDNEFLYSPTSQTYAAGLLNGQFGIYRAYKYGNVTSSSIWLANQKLILGIELKLQRDRSLHVYSSNEAIWGSGTHNGGKGGPFCLVISDMGHLRWINAKKEILWEAKGL
ncbi:unnamed protein product [Adineta ricciae]|uniref:Bulb-type lectin domain-containing protein n=1 Tax=Adineta ricciae TaxID=249248 RepID=A0A816B1I5_ADIRI|nr:unnamed protein product [Adineta ricciae]